MHTADAAKPEIRRRRSSAEVRARILVAAETVFQQNGYEAATTREIAEVAGVAETAVFRHFGSKANLLSEAVLAPFLSFVETFTESWRQRSEQPAVELLADEFVHDLYENLRGQRDSIRALFGALLAGKSTDAMSTVGGRMDDMFARLRVLGEERAEYLHDGRTDSELFTRILVGMVTAMTVLDDWFLPQGDNRPSDESVLTLMSRLIASARPDRTET